ncbi:DUF6452 family protein [Winogradskyella sp. PE311]|uniref:DUF6452 family protein n=1 Tax=Winogradskyella sp. PE311 TaxID=3366943 RepID=UPI00397EBBD8
MKKIKILLLVFALGFISCERDDICAESTATTPQLIIEFYDASNPDDLKSVPRLTVYGEGLPNPNPPETAVDETIIFNTNTNAISLPLLIGNEGETTTSRFILEQDTNLRLDEDDTTVSNIDIIDISYTSEFIYVSRACGYKSIFNNLDLDIEAIDGTFWINNIEITETTIENENTVHVRILH